MYLTVEQIKTIERDVIDDGISFSHLHHDLIDHICCDIEARMQEGKSFRDAYAEIQGDIGDQGLSRIQKETLFLIDKNYRIMKKSMKTLGTVALATISIAALFKIQHWPGASILLTLGFLFVAGVFYPATLFVMYKEMFNRKKVAFVFITFLGGFLFMLGTLFKLQHWPGAGIMMTAGSLGLIITMIISGILFVPSKTSTSNISGIKLTGIIGAILLLLGTIFKVQHWPGAAITIIVGSVMLISVFLPIYSYKVYKETKFVKNSYIFTVYALINVIIFTALLSLNVSKNYLNEFTIPINNQGYTIDFVQGISLNKTTNSSSVVDLIGFIHDTKLLLLKSTANYGDNINLDELTKNSQLIINKDENLSVQSIMIGKDMNGLAFQLKERIDTFKNEVLAMNISPSSKQFIRDILNTNDQFGYDWVDYTFNHMTLISTFTNLSLIEENLRLVEYEIALATVSSTDTSTQMLTQK